MIPSTERHRGRSRLALVTLVVLLAALVLPPSRSAAWAPSYSTPSGITATSRATTALAISWKPVTGAPNYRVQYADNSAMTNAVYRRTTTPRIELSGLRPGATYSIKVRVITLDGVNLTPYSAATRISTRTSGDFPLLSPAGLSASTPSADSGPLSWTERGTSGWYRVQYSASPAMTSPLYRRFNATTGTLTGLTAGTTYYARVRVIDADGANLSSYSPAVTFATPAAVTPALSLSAPSGLKEVGRSATALALTWAAVPGATNYRLQYADNAGMSNAAYVRSVDTYSELNGLASGRTYFVKVRVIDADGLSLSPYSAPVQAATRAADGYPHLAPLQVRRGAVTATTIGLSWASRGSGLSYQVQYDTDAGFASAAAKVVTGTTTTITDVQPGSTYHVRVRVSTTGGDALSEFSDSVSAETPTKSAPLVVASYNVKCANCFAGAPNELTWYERRASVVATIRRQAPDVLGLQEAAQSWLKDSSGDPVNLSQFEDLVNRLGSPYRLANTKRNNCVKHTTPSKCVPADQGASNGTKIVFNSATVSLVAQGSRRLSFLSADDNERFVAWAILRQLASGKEFFFADVHLEHHDDAAGSTAYYDLRRKQAAEALETIKAKNPSGLPVILVGDFNSHKWTKPANGPYDVVVAAGLVDPLGNTYRSTYSAPGATVETRLRTNYSTYNAFKRLAPKTVYVNGTHLDYIFTSPMRVSEWENVMDLNDAGEYVGVIPSDHHLLRATVHLP